MRAKLARGDRLRAFGLRDRELLPRTLVSELRRVAFDANVEAVKPWPLSRYSIDPLRNFASLSRRPHRERE